MKERLRRLEVLEAREHETDAEVHKRYLRGLSDEELNKQIDEMRAGLGEVAWQELVDEVHEGYRRAR